MEAVSWFHIVAASSSLESKGGWGGGQVLEQNSVLISLVIILFVFLVAGILGCALWLGMDQLKVRCGSMKRIVIFSFLACHFLSMKTLYFQ